MCNALHNISFTGSMSFKLLPKIQILFYFQKFLYVRTTTVSYLFADNQINLLFVFVGFS